MYGDIKNDEQLFLNMGLYVNREHQAKTINNHDHKLIDFLQRNRLYILNGRVKGDYSGKATCKNVSSVDYFICSPDLLKSVICLNVLDFFPLLQRCSLSNRVSLRL